MVARIYCRFYRRLLRFTATPNAVGSGQHQHQRPWAQNSEVRRLRPRGAPFVLCLCLCTFLSRAAAAQLAAAAAAAAPQQPGGGGLLLCLLSGRGCPSGCGSEL
jgi:hypothetical protein